ncbi:MAG: SH3 domain-containing protein, partial [Oscillochloris sp.]|nr:SH3 domain-containing protein [Oscillochloris sp.]
TATSTPTPGPTLRVGGQARVVNVGNAFLRARDRPGLDQSIHVVARFPAGSSVSILEGPRQIDGINWWRISGNPGDGWSAERTADGTLLLEALP